MNVAYRTLKLVIDGQYDRHEYLAGIDTSDRIETAGRDASEMFATDADGVDPAALADQLAAVFDDEQFVETIDEVADHDGLVVGESMAVAEAFERQLDDEAVISALSDDELEDAATAFITALQRGLVAADAETATPRLVDIGRTALQDGAFDTAETYLELSRDIADELDDSAAEAATLVALGDGALRRGNLAVAEEYYHEGIDIACEIGDSNTEAAALAGVGNVGLQREALETADEYHRKSLEIARKRGDRSAEANSLASLGTIAGSRGEYELAEQYLEESLDIKRLIGDEVGEATVLASLGNVAVGRDADDIAVQHYTEALDQFTTSDQPREQLQTLENLVTLERERDNSDVAIDYCDRGLALLADTDLSGLEEADRWFRTTRAQLTGDPEDIESLYRAALNHVSEDHEPAAFELLGGVWECRELFEPGTETHGICLRAGVGFAAYHLLLETDAVETTHTELSAEISTHRAALSEPATVLFEFVTSGGSDRDTEIDTAEIDIDANRESIDTLERRTYAGFLNRLTETPPPSELYSNALTAIVNGESDPRDVVQLCLVAWDQRDEAPADSQAILGAILLAEAHREIFEFDLPFDSQEAFDRLAENRSVLSEPMAGLFDRLATGSTDTDTDALLDAADDESPSITDVERMAVARFLGALQD